MADIGCGARPRVGTAWIMPVLDTARVALACPHCEILLPTDWREDDAARCPSCRLVIGPGRARPSAGRPGTGSASGVLVNAARRMEADPVEPELVLSSLQDAAERLGTPLKRLRMLDYAESTAGRDGEPSLAEVLATFSSWKRARAAAAASRSEHLLDG